MSGIKLLFYCCMYIMMAGVEAPGSRLVIWNGTIA